MKLFTRDKHYGEFYLIEWEKGYLQFWSDWGQFLNPKRYNWINFRPIALEFDYERMVQENLTIEFSLLGFNLRLQQLVRETEKGRKLIKDFEKRKKKAKTIGKKDGWTIKAPPEVIKKLESIIPRKAPKSKKKK